MGAANVETHDTTVADAPVPARRPSEPLTLGQRYQRGEVLGRGGMGEVVTAYDAAIGREVAIKSLRAPNPTPLAVRRFLREARIQGRLDHPAIVPVHELARDEHGHPYFVMKKVSGTTLATILAAPDASAQRMRLLHAFVEVCLAIEFAHTRGILHRDLKPSNILLGEFGEVYVLDWGIATAPTDAAGAGSVCGTAAYMAPEQAAGEDVDARADVFALGCVLYEILTGTAWKRAQRASTAPLAPELEWLCLRATAVDRDSRLGSARELAEGVRRFLDGDRDHELRHKLAHEHLANARAALAAGNDDARQRAMREAAKALALAPELDEAAALVGRLMLEPPVDMPPAAAAELAAVDHWTTRRFTLNLVSIHFSTILAFGLLWVFGIRDPLYLTLTVATSGIGLCAACYELATKRDLVLLHNTMIVILAALCARMFTPFLIAPGMIAVNVIAFAFHPAGARRRNFALFAVASLAAVLSMYVLEATGVLAPTMTWSGGVLSLRPPLVGVEDFPCLAALCVQVGVVTLVSGSLAFATAKFARISRDRVHVQAWHVKQLIEAP